MTVPKRATAILAIDLAAIIGNWRRLAAMAPHSGCAAVVKADAYGLGMDKVAPALARAGCTSFFVATIDEGLALRGLLPDSDIFVLGGPLAGAEGDLAESRLVPVLNSAGQIGLWQDCAKRLGRPLDAALHIDTGMCRLGLDERECRSLTGRPELLDGIHLRLVMSHMACADEPDASMNDAQATAFLGLSGLLPKAPLSLAASSTIVLGAQYHFDLLRPGAALYGINPSPGRANPMTPVVRLEGRILQVRDVDTPMTVGYGASHRVKGRGRIATVAVGYADGYLRSLGNRGFGVLAGERVPVVGRISMDLTTFDVSALPEEAACPGALIELIGTSNDVDALAAQAGTIGYEILTALGRRHHRVYGDGTCS